jgi:uncharacterized protein YkwD
MRRFVQLGATIAMVAAMTGLLPGSPALAGSSRYKERHRMLLQTNQSRHVFARANVAIDRGMSTIARHHSVWMASTGKFQHTHDPARVYLQDTPWRCWGENIAVSGGSMRDVEKAFMASPDHKANILDRCFHHVAIGVFRDGDGAAWVTVFFYG